jgi:Mn-dependent DtxR family transcriptional regulator
MMYVTEATENYLEAILVISGRQQEVHAADICTELGFSRPTVSEMVKTMREKKLIEVDGSNHLWLTAAGREIAERIYERHTVLAEMLMRLGVDRETAYADACKMEHDISDVSFACIKRHVREKAG